MHGGAPKWGRDGGLRRCSAWRAMRSGPPAETARGLWSWAEAAVNSVEPKAAGRMEDNCEKPVVFLVEYLDGFRAATLLLPGHLQGFGYAARVSGRVSAIGFNRQGESHQPFTYLGLNVQEMFLTGPAAISRGAHAAGHWRTGSADGIAVPRPRTGGDAPPRCRVHALREGAHPAKHFLGPIAWAALQLEDAVVAPGVQVHLLHRGA